MEIEAIYKAEGMHRLHSEKEADHKVKSMSGKHTALLMTSRIGRHALPYRVNTMSSHVIFGYFQLTLGISSPICITWV